MGKATLILIGFLIFPVAAVPCSGLTVTENRSAGTISLEVNSREAKEISSNPPAANRLAARAGYQILLLAEIPVSVIGQVVLPRVGSRLMEKYSAEILKCARYRSDGFTLTYPVDIDRMRKTWRTHRTDDVATPGSAANTALLDIVSQLENAHPLHGCPES